eukprot:CAMPEP_0118933744 /NCGR_PEP_ID=MMETSP1169-20130426/12325_1 /TAXON_ID=36882 /ORGANISM="Pyramimonas obovata, Strain CCMP722" /LENGTH=325 /DNA_ID=CAMNT_0006876551 /DNA_START=299 /DNA_END=1276 /DNA_ORIENTATION=-
MYATSFLDLQRGLSGMGSGNLNFPLGSMQMEDLMKEINVRLEQAVPPQTSAAGQQVLYQPTPTRGSALPSAPATSAPAATSAPTTAATSAVPELTVPSDLRGKTVEQVWALLRQHSTANEAKGLRKQEGSIAPGDLREISIGTFLDTVGIDGAKSLQNLPGLQQYYPTGRDLAQMAQETLAAQQAATAEKTAASAGTGGGTSDGSENLAEAQPEPAHTTDAAAREAARQARQARMQRKRKEPEPLVEQVTRLQKRKVKNRESAARSRNRKQQYCDALEQEVEKLKEENEALKLKLEGKLDPVEKKGAAADFPLKNRLRRTNTAPC